MTYKKLLVEFDTDRHQNIRLLPGIDTGVAQCANHAHIGLSEAAIAASDYPLVFMKDADSGQFRMVALFGFHSDENLFLHSGTWQGTYLPIIAQSWPFHFGGPDRILCVDEKSGHVSTDLGDRLFDEHGHATQLLNHIWSRADYQRDDLCAADDFVLAVNSFRLISPLKLTLEFFGGRESHVQGLYTIDPQKLSSLAGDKITDLHENGYLGPAYIAANSLFQINRLQQLYNFKFESKIMKIEQEILA